MNPIEKFRGLKVYQLLDRLISLRLELFAIQQGFSQHGGFSRNRQRETVQAEINAVYQLLGVADR